MIDSPVVDLDDSLIDTHRRHYKLAVDFAISTIVRIDFDSMSLDCNCVDFVVDYFRTDRHTVVATFDANNCNFDSRNSVLDSCNSVDLIVACIVVVTKATFVADGVVAVHSDTDHTSFCVLDSSNCDNSSRTVVGIDLAHCHPVPMSTENRLMLASAASTTDAMSFEETVIVSVASPRHFDEQLLSARLAVQHDSVDQATPSGVSLAQQMVV